MRSRGEEETYTREGGREGRGYRDSFSFADIIVNVVHVRTRGSPLSSAHHAPCAQRSDRSCISATRHRHHRRRRYTSSGGLLIAVLRSGCSAARAAGPRRGPGAFRGRPVQDQPLLHRAPRSRMVEAPRIHRVLWAAAHTSPGRPEEAGRHTAGAQRSGSWATSAVRRAAAGPGAENAARAGPASAVRRRGSRGRAVHRGAEAWAADARVATRSVRLRAARRRVHREGDSRSARQSRAQVRTMQGRGQSLRRRWRTRDGACANAFHCSTRPRPRSRRCLRRLSPSRLRSRWRVRLGRWGRRRAEVRDA